MTEAEWIKSTKPELMIQWVAQNERKARLVACAFCRRVWPFMQHAESRIAVEVAERFADGTATELERSTARKQAQVATQARGTTPLPTDPKWGRRAASAAYYSVAGEAVKAALAAREMAIEALIWREGGPSVCDWRAITNDEEGTQSRFIRDVFGNPFRPVAVDSAWRTSTVLALAQGIYDERAFDRMPILADALQDAGCDSEDILTHCRGPGPHVRGCWVVDLVLGKA